MMFLTKIRWFSMLVAASVAACSSSETKTSSGTTGTGGHGGSGSTTTGAGGGGGSSTGTGGGGGPINAGASVLQHHKNATRDGLYVDAAITVAAAPAMHVDTTFNAVIQGAAYAQPLYVDGGPGGKDMVFAATEQNWIHALDAATGAEIWKKQLGAPVKLSNLPCGNIDPLGITGTPVIDLPSRTIFADAMTTPDGGATKKHLIFGLSIDDGSVRAGYPIDVSAAVKMPAFPFDSKVQNQRGALAIVNGTLYVPYGGHYGDCGSYRGWLVGVPLANPAMVGAWATPAVGGGAWAPGGVASDGTSIFMATGNTFGAVIWSGGEAVLRFDAGPTFSTQSTDYFSPTDWKALDSGDVDIGGSGPVLFDVAGASPSKLVISLGKNGKAYVLDRQNLGGVNDGLASDGVSNNEIINAAAAYSTDKGTFAIFNGSGANCPNGQSGDLVALSIGAASPPTLSTAWCADNHGSGSPMVTTTDGHAGAIVWTAGVQGDGKLHGYDGSTGQEIFTGGGGADGMSGLRRFATPMAAKGRIFVGATDKVYAFTSQ